jgi:hypothetical protein
MFSAEKITIMIFELEGISHQVPWKCPTKYEVALAYRFEVCEGAAFDFDAGLAQEVDADGTDEQEKRGWEDSEDTLLKEKGEIDRAVAVTCGGPEGIVELETAVLHSYVEYRKKIFGAATTSCLNTLTLAVLYFNCSCKPTLPKF